MLSSIHKAHTPDHRVEKWQFPIYVATAAGTAIYTVANSRLLE